MKKMLILLLFVCGCSMSIGTYEPGLWFDHDKKVYQPKGFGVKADLVCGRFVRPFGGWEEPGLVLDFPFCAPFFSIALNEMGFYIGAKSFRNHRGRYDWLPSDADPNNPEILFTPSATTRRTRWK